MNHPQFSAGGSLVQRLRIYGVDFTFGAGTSS